MFSAYTYVINTGETYTVTYATTEGGSVNPPSQSDQVLSNEAITGSIATPNTGYKFLGWFEEAVAQ